MPPYSVPSHCHFWRTLRAIYVCLALLLSCATTQGQSALFPTRLFPVGVGPVAYALADFDQDGRPDLALANESEGTLQLLTNTGKGNFSPPLSIATIPGVATLVAADFNGDNSPDLLAASNLSNSLTLLLNRGDGSFQIPLDLFLTGTPRALAVGDLNGDSRPEIAVALADTPEIVLFWNSEQGEFFSISLTVDLPVTACAFGDMNRDGKCDIVTADANAVRVSLQTEEGTFATTEAQSIALSAKSLSLADLDGDGNLDIALIHEETLHLLLGNGDGTLREGPALPSLTATALLTGDLNGDGKPDLLALDEAQDTLWTLVNRGEGNFWPARSYFPGPGPRALALADFTQDGFPDVVTLNYNFGQGETMGLLWGYGNGLLQSGQRQNLGNSVYTQPNGIASGDFNNDGRSDIVTVNEDSTLFLLLNNGDMTFQTRSVYAVGAGPKAVKVGDFNQDGFLDVVTANERSDTLSVLLGNGLGSFPTRSYYPAGQGPRSLAVGDFNGNGCPDIAALSKDGQIRILLNADEGKFIPLAPYRLPNRPIVLASGDFDRDGRVDLLAGNYISDPILGNTVSLLRGTAEGVQRSPSSFTIGGTPADIVVCDLNGDGAPDIISANYNLQTVSVLLNNGSGGFLPVVNYPAPRKIYALALADFNGDGSPDIAATSYVDGLVGILLNQGDGTFISEGCYAAWSRPQTMLTADYNGDGLPDLVIANLDTNALQLLLNTGGGKTATLAGTLTLQSLSVDAAPQRFTFTFRPEEGSAWERSVSIGPDGAFALLGIPPGRYTVHIKGAKYLARNLSLEATAGAILPLKAELIPGDANGDNTIDIFDLATLAEAFNSLPNDINWNPDADFNGDNSVDIFDLAILAENFNTEGDL